MQRVKVKDKKESFMKGVLVLMISQVFIKILGLVYKLYLTNREGFGDAGNAIYSSGYQIYALLLTISSVGVPNAISKLVSEKLAVGDERAAYRIFRISFATFALIGFLCSSAMFFGAGYIANVMLDIPEAELTIVALSPSIFFVAIISVIRGFFNGREKISATAKSQTIEQIFKTVLTVIIVEIVAIMSSTNTTIMAAGANLATTMSTIISFVYLYILYKMYKEELKTKIRNSRKTENVRIRTIIKRILIVSLPISLSAVMSTLSKNIDSITVVRSLKTFLSAEEAKAQYGILGGKVDALTMLPLSFNVAFATALVPAVASALAKRDIKTAKDRISFSILITILIGLPCTIGLCVFAEPIIKLLFPNATAGTLLLQITAFTVFFTVINQTINGALQGMGKVVVPAIAGGIGLIVKLILNLILVPNPRFGAAGAAFATVANCIISCAIVFIVLIKNIKLEMRLVKYLIKPVIATLMMTVCLLYSYSILNSLIGGRIAIVLALCTAVIIYVLSILILKILNREDIYMLPGGEKIYLMLERLGIYGK